MTNSLLTISDRIDGNHRSFLFNVFFFIKSMMLLNLAYITIV